MFEKTYQELNQLINKLESSVESCWSLTNNYNPQEWKKVFELIGVISKSFKETRYPTGHERDIAWQKYSSIRDKAFRMKDEQIQATSSYYKDDLFYRLKNLAYNPYADALVGDILSLGLMSATKEELKALGKELNEVSKYFKSVKHHMTKEHKNMIHSRIVEIRESHDVFWSRYKEYSQAHYNQQKAEKQRLWEEKQRVWEEKQEKSRRIRSRIEQNLESNIEKLRKAENALDRTIRNRDNLKDKIYESTNNNWIDKAEGWLRETEDKIDDIRNSIYRIEGWIREDRNKLDNWN